MLKQALFIILVSFTIASCHTVSKTIRRTEVDFQTLRIDDALIPFQTSKRSFRSKRYYHGTRLVCIIDRKGISSMKASYSLK